MTEQLAMNNILTIIKSLNTLLLSGTIESSNEDVHKEFKKNLDDFLKLQNEIYLEMQNQGWYKLQNVESSVINKTLKKLETTK